MADDRDDRGNAGVPPDDENSGSSGGKKKTLPDLWGSLKNVYANLKKGQVAMTAADSYVAATAHLTQFNNNLGKQAQLQEMVYEASQRTRTGYEDFTKTVVALGNAAPNTFSNNSALVDFARTVQQATSLSGADAGGRAKVTEALGEGLRTGTMSTEGAEALGQYATPLMEAITNQFNQGESLMTLAEQGQITAEVIGRAMTEATDSIGVQFARMPMKFAEIGAVIKNGLLQTFTPLIQTIGEGARWVYDNWSMVAPAFWGLAAAVGAYSLVSRAQAILTAVNTVGTIAFNISAMAQALAMGAVALATGNATLAQSAWSAAISASPIGWIVLIIGVVVAMLYRWVQAMGGVEIAWMIVCNTFYNTLNGIKTGLAIASNALQSFFGGMCIGAMGMSIGFQNTMGDMKTGVLLILEGMVNGGIKIINGFINQLNQIPGVSIGLLDEVTFGTTAQLENEAAKQVRNAQLATYEEEIRGAVTERETVIAKMQQDAANERRWRDLTAKTKQAQAIQEGGGDPFPYGDDFNVESVGSVGSVGSIGGDVSVADEDLQFMKDVAEMRYVQNFVTLTPQVSLDAKINQRVDIMDVVGQIEHVLVEQIAVSAEEVYA